MRVTSVISQVGVNIFGIVKGVLALKLMISQGPETYAMLSQYIIISTLIVQLVTFNYDIPFISDLANNQSEEKAYSAILVLITSVFIFLLLGALLFPAGIANLVWAKSSYAIYIIWLLLYSVLLTFNHVAVVISNGRKRFKTTSFLQIVQQIIQLVALSIGVFNESIYIVLISLIAGEALILIVGLKLVPRPALKLNEFSFKNNWLIDKFHVALPLLLGSMMIWIVMNGGRFAVVHISHLDELSKYAATFSVAILSGLFINPICTTFLPYFSMGKANREISAAKVIIAGSITLLILTSLVSMFLLNFGELILNSLSGLKIYAGDEFILIVCLSQLIYGQVRLLTLYLAVNGNSSASRRSLLIGAAVFVSVIYPLTSEWRSTGAATAILLSMMVSLFSMKKWIFHIENVAQEFIHRGLIVKIWCCSLGAILIFAIFKGREYNVADVKSMCFAIGVVAVYIVALALMARVTIRKYKSILKNVW